METTPRYGKPREKRPLGILSINIRLSTPFPCQERFLEIRPRNRTRSEASVVMFAEW
jgi:hypothetical protein